MSFSLDTPGMFVLIIDLLGTFAFALNGALTAARFVRLDIVGVVALGLITAVGGGIVRDVLLGDIPPAAFTDWYYLAVAFAGSLIAFFITRPHRVFNSAVRFFDSMGLSLFCVVGAMKALDYGLGPVPAVLLGTITAVGGGTIRDIMTAKVPTILTSSSGLYAIPALLGAALAVLLVMVTGGSREVIGIPFELFGAALCFAIRAFGVRFGINAPAARTVFDVDDEEPHERDRGTK